MPDERGESVGITFPEISDSRWPRDPSGRRGGARRGDRRGDRRLNPEQALAVVRAWRGLSSGEGKSLHSNGTIAMRCSFRTDDEFTDLAGHGVLGAVG
ncbi:hypothetical protein GCM10010185_60170 [Saccharothrix coeruleofusca]|uniref:Uncharacterized protein n=1 Tax=Saccharothrix coeruleofusca TaxID=33919 RepID=A0A918ASR9_9PSEU|nr:hypothetical protein GCM10010185_60170 [Saccharothrix coeruleofusca]